MRYTKEAYSLYVAQTETGQCLVLKEITTDKWIAFRYGISDAETNAATNRFADEGFTDKDLEGHEWHTDDFLGAFVTYEGLA